MTDNSSSENSLLGASKESSPPSVDFKTMTDHSERYDDEQTMVGNEDSVADNDEDFEDSVKQYNTPLTANYNREMGTLESSTLVAGNYGEDHVNPYNEGTSRKVHRSILDSSHDQQLFFNDKRILLTRSLYSATAVVQQFRQKNIEHPFFYPSNALDDESNDIMLNNNNSRVALIKQTSERKLEKRSMRSEDYIECDHKFEILKVNIKMDPATGTNIISTLDKSAVSMLLNQKLLSTARHLHSLKERLDDTSSKVLVTGDLNSGKSAFCNALLRKKLLPEDQQPCTNVFCEIINAKENNGVEEVYAVLFGKKFNVRDESTYEVFPLSELETLVHRSDIYSWLYIYAYDNRPEEYSLLKNGVIDIRLIDAPGLNLDSYQTTQLYSRQEEIDLIVFVVNAENYFTLSGREFISAATNDKNLIFMVVNKFDKIEDKEKCKEKIMDQVKTLSPETHKDSTEFVHFVSSNGVLSDVSDGIEGNANDNGNDNDNDNGNGNDGNNNPDFDHLEASLRNFVLEKRSTSKLLPAKNYLLKLYKDLRALADFNEKVYRRDLSKANSEFKSINPQYEKNVQNSTAVIEKVNKVIESTSSKIYEYSRSLINSRIASLGNIQLEKFEDHDTFGQFAEKTQQSILDKIMESIDISEEFARTSTSSAVDEIRKLGEEAVGLDKLSGFQFVPTSMYTNRKHGVLRQLDEDIAISDFIDPNFESFCKLYGIRLPNAKLTAQVVLTSKELWATSFSGAFLVYSPKLISMSSTAVSITSYVPNWVWKYVVFTSLGVGIVATAGYYLYKDAPYAYQRNVVKKLKMRIEEEDYNHINSHRIAKECRKVLQYPSMDVTKAVQNLLDDTASKRKKVLQEIEDCNSCIAFYTKLGAEISQRQQTVESCSLDM